MSQGIDRNQNSELLANGRKIEIRPKVSLTTVILTLFVFVAMGFTGFHIIKTKRLKAQAVSLLPGESLPSVELVNIDNETLDNASLAGGSAPIICLFLFESPCAKCTKNIAPWRTITEYFGDRITAFGIFRDGDPAAFGISENGGVNFKLYMPVDTTAFNRSMRLKENQAQTIVLFNNKVKIVKFGNLELGDLNQLIDTITELVENQGGFYGGS